jgi:hypothetical protein
LAKLLIRQETDQEEDPFIGLSGTASYKLGAVSSVMLPHPALKSRLIILGSAARVGIEPFVKLVL